MSRITAAAAWEEHCEVSGRTREEEVGEEGRRTPRKGWKNPQSKVRDVSLRPCGKARRHGTHRFLLQYPIASRSPIRRCSSMSGPGWQKQRERGQR